MSQNRLFVADKPTGISCNFFLSQIKKRYGVKKAGFSGTLDPFASGALIVAFGQYTKLFRFLKKAPKRYLATLHFGAKSKSLDTENVESIEEVSKLELEKIKNVAKDLVGGITYTPPKFSAKKVDGKRAYELAREDKEFTLKEITTEIYELNILEYNHPFLSFEIEVSEGGYIRSIAEILAKRVGTFGSLSALKRLKEGKFDLTSSTCSDEKALKVTDFLDLKENFYKKDFEDILLGKKLKKEDFDLQYEGEYFLANNSYLSVIKIEKDEVMYELNGVKLC